MRSLGKHFKFTRSSTWFISHHFGAISPQKLSSHAPTSSSIPKSWPPPLEDSSSSSSPSPLTQGETLTYAREQLDVFTGSEDKTFILGIRDLPNQTVDVSNNLNEVQIPKLENAGIENQGSNDIGFFSRQKVLEKTIGAHLAKNVLSKPNTEHTIRDVYAAYQTAVDKNVKLTEEQLNTVLWACYESRKDNRSNVIVDVYDKMKRLNCLNMDTYNTILQTIVGKPNLFVTSFKGVYEIQQHVGSTRLSFIDAVCRDYVFKYYNYLVDGKISKLPPDDLIVPFIKARLHGNQLSKASKLFEVLKEKGIPGSAAMYWKLARSFCTMAKKSTSLDALRHMTQIAKIVPTTPEAHKLLRIAASKGDVKVLKTVLHWYVHNWEGARVEYGLLKRILHVAGSMGNSGIAFATQTLMERMGYQMHYTDYICLIRSCLVGDFSDLLGALRVLYESEKMGLDIYSDPDLGQDITHLFGRTLSSNVLNAGHKKVDEAYYATMQLKKERKPMKNMMLAVNAIIIGYGKKNRYDKAYTTFLEYMSVFNNRPTIYTYNALLLAASYSEDVSVEKLLNIFQEMEAANVSPDATSFSILCEVMAITRHLEGFNDVHEHMKSLGLRVRPRSFRMVLIALCKEGSFEAVDKLAENYYRNVDVGTGMTSLTSPGSQKENNDDDKKDQCDEYNVMRDDRPIMPRFLATRIKTLRERHYNQPEPFE